MEILVLEASTVSAKAAVFDLERGVVSTYSEPFATDVRSTAEHDVGRVVDTLFAAGARVAAGHDIKAVGCVCTGHTTLLLDKALEPVSPAYTWTYNRGTDITRRIRADRELTRGIYKETGCMVHTIYPLYRCMFLRDEMGLPLDSGYIVSEGSYIFCRLTGERAEAECAAAASAFASIHTLQWSERIAELSKISTERFFPIRSNRYAAALRADAAERLGVKSGIPVSIPMIDGALNQLGAGMIDTGKMTVSIGTSGAMRMTSDRPLLPDSMGTWCYNTLDKYLCGATISGATNCVDWFRRGYLPGVSYGALEELIRVPKEDAPVFLPFLFGERCPGWRDDRPGGFFNLKDSHEPGDLYTAILEGVVFNLYQNYDILTSVGGEAEAVNLSGGVLRSGKWAQMTADIFGREMLASTFEQIASVGAACIAFEHCGGVKNAADYSLPEATAFTIRPDMERHSLYERRFQSYLDAYERTK